MNMEFPASDRVVTEVLRQEKGCGAKIGYSSRKSQQVVDT